MPQPDPSAARDALGHFATAFAFLLAGLAALVWNSSRLAVGEIGDARVVGGLHWLTLGWLSLSIFGALRVFSGVALGSVGYGRWLSRAVWGPWAAGAIVFPVGLMRSSSSWIISGALLLFLALVCFSVHFAPALWNATRGRLTRAYLVIALVSLWCAWILGAGAGFLRAGWLAWEIPPGYFQAHLLMAIFGWVGATVVGVGSHLIPMFALSSNPRQWAVKAALPIWIGIPLWAALGAFRPEPFLALGWVSAAVGSALWAIQVFLYFSTRLRKERDWGLYIAAGATAVLPIAWLLLLLRKDNAVAFGGTVLIGWLTLFTLGIYHRVIPFLVWFQKYAGRMGRGRVPRVKELTNERVMGVTAALALGGVVLWSGGLMSHSAEAVYAGSGALLGAGLSALAQLRSLFGAPKEKKKAPPAFMTLEVKTR